MPTLRKDPLDGTWHLFAPNRLERPNACGETAVDGGSPCPFCPGNEHLTPPEVDRVDDERGWIVRVVPNLYPAVGADDTTRHPSETSAEGEHEVIVDSRDHDRDFDELTHDETSATVGVWIARYRALRREAPRRTVVLFRNRGARAGESIAHPHSQVIGLPWVPPRLAAERRGAREARDCLLCRVGASADQSRHVVARTDSFLLLAPFSSRLPYQQWIVPMSHAPNFTDLGDHDRQELAGILGAALRATKRVLPDASFNWSLQQEENDLDPRFHWYLEIQPRITSIGGFELATGAYINIVDPSIAAERLRVAIEEERP